MADVDTAAPAPDKLWDERDRQAVEDYIGYLLRALELSDWRVRLKKSEADSGNRAEIWPTYGQRTAELYLGHDFRELEPDDARRVLVHELLHLHASGYQHHVESDELKQLLGQPAWRGWFAGFRQLNEAAIDGIARAIAPLLEPFAWPRSPA